MVRFDFRFSKNLFNEKLIAIGKNEEALLILLLRLNFPFFHKPHPHSRPAEDKSSESSIQEEEEQANQ